ncbi:MAG TPA: ATP-binding protein [Egibacteraceae bacterium]|nr:ATP-binding protein [Actinomycetota bacterium]HWB71172.1 ATP-binding protein [Egibacteraceae bacterium]
MPAAPPLIRDYRHEDLGRVVGLWEQEGVVPIGPDGLTVDEATDLMASDDAEVLVADLDGDIVGVAVGAVSGVVGVVFRILGDGEVAARLLTRLEERLADRGARKLIAELDRSTEGCERLAEHGYRVVEERVILERPMPSTTAGPSAVSRLGGQMVEPALWDRLEGMEEAKRLIERRIILPLAEPEMAYRHGVSTPRAVILFGPPGTGKTTFARGIASRLEWPFVEIHSSELAEQGATDESRILAETFDRLLELPSAVAFLDEVEDIAADREGEREFSYRVTTEFLRQLPRLRDAPHHLLVCATNRIGTVDPGFLRPGRFDYVLPVGPPGEQARAAMWRSYIEEITDEDVDVDALVDESGRYTPADVEFAARKAAQLAFERQYFDQSSGRATTEDFLTAIDQTPASLTEEMIEQFERDVERFARH